MSGATHERFNRRGVAEMFPALKVRRWQLLPCSSSSAHRYWASVCCAHCGPYFGLCDLSHNTCIDTCWNTSTHTHTNRCSLRPAAASALPSVAASDSVCRTWGCSTPGDSLAVRKSCLLFIFTAQHSPTLGHSHPCNTSKNLYLPALAAFPPPLPSRDSHQLAYLRAEPCKYTLNACFYELCYIALRGRNGFCWYLEDCSPHETHWVRLVYGLYDQESKLQASALAQTDSRILLRSVSG